MNNTTSTRRLSATAARRQTSLEAYETAQADIRTLLGRINLAVDAHDRRGSSNPGGHDWGFVGDLTSVRSSLTEVLAFLNGEQA